MEDGSLLLFQPARISPSRFLPLASDVSSNLENGKMETSDVEVKENFKPVRVVICRSEDTDGGGHTKTSSAARPPPGREVIHRLVTGCRGYDFGKPPALPPSFLAAWTTTMANGHHDLSTTVVDARERERKEMQGLNEKFAEYIEKVRFLEAQNKRLSRELEETRRRFGRESRKVKVAYQTELSDARRKFDDLDRDKVALEVKVTSLGEQLAEALERIRELELALKEERELTVNALHKCADLESQSGYLTRKLSDLETSKERNLARISKLNDQLQKLKTDLDEETLSLIDSENRRRTLEEQENFMRAVHDQEMKELAGLVCRDSTAENREYWRAEMEKAIREIVQLFEEQLKGYRDDMEASYDWKIREYVSGNNDTNHSVQSAANDQRLVQMKDCLGELSGKLMDTEDKNQMLIREIESLRRQRDGLTSDQLDEINKVTLENLRLKSELSSVKDELHSVGDDKLSLERELEAYKKIVEETPGGSKQIFEHDIHVTSEEQGVRRSRPDQSIDLVSSESRVARESVKGEVSSKVRVMKSSKGGISIKECADDGSHVTLENFGSQDENLSGWYLERKVDDSGPPVRFTFPTTTTTTATAILKPGMQIKIWSGDKKRDMLARGELIFDGGTWKTGGDKCSTILYNPLDEERATHIQETKYS